MRKVLAFSWLKSALLVLAALGVLSMASPAQADFRIRIEDLGPGTGVTITDNAAGDLNPLANVILYSGVIGGFTVSVSVGTATPALSAPGFYDAIDLTNVSILSAGAATLRVILEKDGFGIAPDGPLVLVNSVGGVLTAPAGSSATFFSGANPGNLVPTLGPDTGGMAGALPPVTDLPPAGTTTAGPQSFGPGAFSGTVAAGFTKAGPYSLFSAAFVAFTGPGSVSFDHLTATTPEPSSILIALFGVPALAMLRKRFGFLSSATS